jgi:hypothetical protein
METALSELLPGLYRWSAPHPDWEPDAEADGPDDWGQMVASHLYEAPDAVALFDPLLPGENREAFLQLLDALIAGRPVSVLTTIRWHRRDRQELAARYRDNSSRAWNAVPHGVEQKPLRGAGETAYWLPAAESLLFGDRLLGEEGGVKLCPESWLRRERVDRAGLAHLMRPLIELPVERLLVSHGEPVLHDGRAALARAIRAAEA